MWDNFHLLRPWWLLALLPLAWVIWRILQYKSADSPWRKLVDPHLLPHLLVTNKIINSNGILWLLGLGGVIWILALAGPAWRTLPQPVYRVQTQLVIVLDLSLSMNTTDVLPSRLAQARFKVLDLLQRIQEGQVAMTVYGPEPFLVSPLTTDTATIAAQVPLLDNTFLPVQGERRTDLAIIHAKKLLQHAGSHGGEILLITNTVSPLAVSRQAAVNLRNHGYRLSILGIGTIDGAPIPLNEGGFVKDEDGAIVLSKLELEDLQALATSGGGQYLTAGIDNQDIEALISNQRQMNALQQQMLKQTMQTDKWQEEGPWLLLLLLPLAALGFRRGWLGFICLYLIILQSPAWAFGWQDLWWRSDQQAAQQFAAGQHKKAAHQFQRLDWKAAAEYKAGNYAQALNDLQQIKNPDADTHYNRGNALAKLGRFEAALTAYEQTLTMNPDHKDAKTNRDLMRQILNHQQQQKQQSSQQNQHPQQQD
ncbi:hypothetical protein TI03_03535, partial [Achromatium sp. WMS1]